MPAPMDFNLREHLKDFRETVATGDKKQDAALNRGKEARFYVLVDLILRANPRNRCWPGRDRIAADTDYTEAVVSSALQWLFNRGAIYNVPYEQRIGEERDLPPRKYVFQLTGVIRLAGQIIRYLYLEDDHVTYMISELRELGAEELVDMFKGVFNERLQNKRLKNKRSQNEPKGITDSLEGNTGKDSAADAATRSRDVVFDAVVEHCFGTDPLNALEVQQLGGGYVGMIASALRKAYKGVLDDQQLADELGQFAAAWAETELTMPQHENSLLPNFKRWRDANTRTQPAAVLQRPLRVRASCDDPTCKNGYVKTANGRELCPNCWTLPEEATA